jgi:hypothetical protein
MLIMADVPKLQEATYFSQNILVLQRNNTTDSISSLQLSSNVT